VFTTPDFDANEYANAILAGDPYPPANQQSPSKPRAAKPTGEDIDVAISKLNFGIEDVGKQIKNVVCQSSALEQRGFLMFTHCWRR
jgi:conserved oligomeric Golgi complex subunit 5